MDINAMGPGSEAPDLVNVIIEIPTHGAPVKYEVDKASGAMVVDRFLSTAMYYPCNYGYVPQTLSNDGDPCDVLVVTPSPLLTGSVIEVRPVGMLNMTDESGEDAKILAVPKDSLCRHYRHVKTLEDLPAILLEQIEHFFTHYKDLEPSKWVKVEGWEGIDAAKAELKAGIARHQETETA
ncbi:MAG: inorganic pyrophosphatase [marine bacterium B5-7]|nr:MAG: inorganic pyrophosphatase [marine bacterium B5-7]